MPLFRNCNINSIKWLMAQWKTHCDTQTKNKQLFSILDFFVLRAFEWQIWFTNITLKFLYSFFLFVFWCHVFKLKYPTNIFTDCGDSSHSTTVSLTFILFFSIRTSLSFLQRINLNKLRSHWTCQIGLSSFRLNLKNMKSTKIKMLICYIFLKYYHLWLNYLWNTSDSSR